MFARITDYLQDDANWHYYYNHAIIAAAIHICLAIFLLLCGVHPVAASAVGAWTSIAIYGSRKETEYEKDTDPANRFDKIGLEWPVCTVLWLHLSTMLAFRLLNL